MHDSNYPNFLLKHGLFNPNPKKNARETLIEVNFVPLNIHILLVVVQL